jgi:hypothetical protein
VQLGELADFVVAILRHISALARQCRDLFAQLVQALEHFRQKAFAPNKLVIRL